MSEEITREEMAKGTAPTRAERIMLTPVEEVLAKDSWDDVDFEILMNNRHKLDKKTLDKLGIEKVKPLTPEEVKAQTHKMKEANLDTAAAESNAEPEEEEEEAPVEAEVVDTKEK